MAAYHANDEYAMLSDLANGFKVMVVLINKYDSMAGDKAA